MDKANREQITVLKESLNHVLKLLSSAIIVILLMIGMFLVWYFIQAKVIAKKAGAVPIISLYTIISGSMEPAIKVYDIILDVRIDKPSTVKVGDVITFLSSSGDKTITHRVMDIKKVENNYEFVTKGDANYTADSSTVKENQLIGKTVFKIPQLGRIQMFMLSKIGWIFVILIPALCIVIYDFLKLFKLVGVNESSRNIKLEDSVLELKQNDENKKIQETIERIKKNHNI